MTDEYIKIRKAKKADFEDFLNLQKEFFQIYKKLSKYKIKELSKKDCKKEFDLRFGKDKFFYVAEHDGKIVGYLFGIVEHSVYGVWGSIEDLFVKIWGKGIATLLKNKFIKSLKKRKIKICRIDVNPENKKVIEVYHKWGFKIDKYRMTKMPL